VKSFFEDIFIQFKKAHLIIARAGGSSIAEILAANRPTIFIPLPAALDNHQEENAKYIVKNKGGWLLDQNKTSPKLFKTFLKDLILNPKKLKEASIQIKKISSYHLSLCNKKTPTIFFIDTITKLLPLNIKEDLKS
jgi:UDP-N-acetylglucosamine--N-acetylmuramyl-(pentapeptide) pyrophosphoryl-undecaprenol N-acetylglucosamine transferase